MSAEIEDLKIDIEHCKIDIEHCKVEIEKCADRQLELWLVQSKYGPTTPERARADTEVVLLGMRVAELKARIHTWQLRIARLRCVPDLELIRTGKLSVEECRAIELRVGERLAAAKERSKRVCKRACSPARTLKRAPEAVLLAMEEERLKHQMQQQERQRHDRGIQR